MILDDYSSYNWIFGIERERVIRKITKNQRKILRNKFKRDVEKINFNRAIIKTEKGFFLVLMDLDYYVDHLGFTTYFKRSNALYMLNLETYELAETYYESDLKSKELNEEIKIEISKLYNKLTSSRLCKTEVKILTEEEYDFYIIDDYGRYKLRNDVMKY